MILFIYLIAFIYNKKINIKIDIKKRILINILIFFLFLFIMNKYYINFDTINLYLYWNNRIEIGLNKIYTHPNNLFRILLISYLFYIIVVIVWLTVSKIGRLRTKI